MSLAPAPDPLATASAVGVATNPPQAATRGRDRYLDLIRAAALVRVVAYHMFGWAWLTIAFPAMGLMFALAGSLMAGSLDRGARAGLRGHTTVARRLRRLLPPLWIFGAVSVTLMLLTGWRKAPDAPLGWGELVWWIFPARTPPVGEQSWAWAHNVVLWYIVTYLWLILLSPLALALFRRWPWPTLLATLLLPVAFHFNVVNIGGYFNEQATNVASYAACWVLGFAHHDGLLRRIPARRYAAVVAALAASGAVWLLVVGTSTGVFDANRILGGNTLWSVAFVAAMLRFRPPMAWLDRVRPVRRAVELLNARAVTVYLWHLPAGVLATALLAPLAVPGVLGHLALPLLGVWVLTAVAVALFGWAEDLAAGRRVELLPKPAAQVAVSTSVPGRRGWDRAMLAFVVVLAVMLVVVVRSTPPPATAGAAPPPAEVVRDLTGLVVAVDPTADQSTGATSGATTSGATASGVTADGVTIDGAEYRHAVVVPAPSRLRLAPPAGCGRLRAEALVDDAGDGSAITFTVVAHGYAAYTSDGRTRADSPALIDVDITGSPTIDLVVTGRGAGATAVWADAHLLCAP